jgi:hypothetical protein
MRGDRKVHRCVTALLAALDAKVAASDGRIGKSAPEKYPRSVSLGRILDSTGVRLIARAHRRSRLGYQAMAFVEYSSRDYRPHPT